MSRTTGALATRLACLPTGIRPGARYRRRGCANVEHDGENMSALRTEVVLARARGVALHSARRWTERDTAIMTEFEARCWTWCEGQNLRGLSLPMWLVRPEVDRKHLLILMHVLNAYRHGACGLLLSYEEAVALGLSTSRTTWWRDVKALEADGLIVRDNTWREAPVDKGGRPREYARVLYQPGSRLFDLAGGEPGALEGLHEDNDGRDYDDRKAERQRRAESGAHARREARVARRAKLHLVWSQQRGPIEREDRENAHAEAELDEPTVAHVTPEGHEITVHTPRPSKRQQERARREARQAVREALEQMRREDAAEPRPAPPRRPSERAEGREPPALSLESGGHDTRETRRERPASPIPRFTLKPQTSRGGDSNSERELQGASAGPRSGPPRLVSGPPDSRDRAGGSRPARTTVPPLGRSNPRASTVDLAGHRELREQLAGLSPADLAAFRDALAQHERSERRVLDVRARARFAMLWRAMRRRG